MKGEILNLKSSLMSLNKMGSQIDIVVLTLQNRMGWRKENTNISKMARCLFHQSKISQTYWPEVVNTFIFLVSRFPTLVLKGIYPHQELIRKKLYYHF